jgi:hypothetical protein
MAEGTEKGVSFKIILIGDSGKRRDTQALGRLP